MTVNFTNCGHRPCSLLPQSVGVSEIINYGTPKISLKSLFQKSFFGYYETPTSRNRFLGHHNMRLFGYARVSTSQQSLDAQIKTLLAWWQ